LKTTTGLKPAGPGWIRKPRGEVSRAGEAARRPVFLIFRSFPLAETGKILKWFPMDFPPAPAVEDPAVPAPSASEQYLSLIFANAANMMALFRVEPGPVLTLISLNPAYLRVVRAAGYPIEARDLIGRRLEELFANVFRFSSDDIALVMGRYRRAVAASEPVSYEEIHDTPNGRSFGETTLSAIRAGDGSCAFILFSSTDVTERRRADETRRQLEAELQQAHKLQALGTLAGGVAHDFNNIVTAIMGNAQLLEAALPPGSRTAVFAQQIVEASQRARDVVRQVLTFSRQQPPERAEGRLQPIVKAVLGLLRPTWPANIEVRTEFPAPEPAVLIDAGQIHQVLMNLCLNSAHAMRARGGCLTIRETVVGCDDPFRVAHPHASATRHVLLEVGDTGHGMDEETRQRVFEPFFTTKGPGEGTGLGCAVVHGIVGAHDGIVEVASRSGEGATFSVYLPIMVPAAPAAGAASGHILFVDDEEAVRSLGKSILERYGYRVTLLPDGPAALALLRAAPGTVAAVVTDFSMPEMNGMDLAREAQRLEPRLPFVIITGNAESSLLQPGELQQILAKPFAVSDLAKAVRGALERAPAG
jgi:signal transduction histidine kinase